MLYLYEVRNHWFYFCLDQQTNNNAFHTKLSEFYLTFQFCILYEVHGVKYSAFFILSSLLHCYSQGSHHSLAFFVYIATVTEVTIPWT